MHHVDMLSTHSPITKYVLSSMYMNHTDMWIYNKDLQIYMDNNSGAPSCVAARPEMEARVLRHDELRPNSDEPHCGPIQHAPPSWQPHLPDAKTGSLRRRRRNVPRPTAQRQSATTPTTPPLGTSQRPHDEEDVQTALPFFIMSYKGNLRNVSIM